MVKLLEAGRKELEQKLSQNMRILLAEDNELNAELAKTLLEMKGILVDIVHNGKEVVEVFQQSEIWYYRAILMDIRMPIMDGLEATRRIRSFQKEDAKEIPIIAITVNNRKEDIEKSLEAGMNAHLPKPINPRQMFAVLEEYGIK